MATKKIQATSCLMTGLPQANGLLNNLWRAENCEEIVSVVEHGFKKSFPTKNTYLVVLRDAKTDWMACQSHRLSSSGWA